MPRRRRSGVIDAGGETATDIEILDLDALRYGTDNDDTGTDNNSPDTLEVEPNTSLSAIAVIAAAVVGAVALFGVVTTGNSPAPEPPAPSVTVPPEPISAEQAEIAELEATYGVEIGDGPGLQWEPVVWNIDTNDFQWVDDGFVGHNGVTEWTVRLNMVGPTVSQRENLALAYPGYQLQLVNGARLLLPDSGPADHLLAAVGDQDPIRFDLPAYENPPVSDLVRPVRVEWDGAVLDDHIVVTSFFFLDVDLQALGLRVGRDLNDFDFVAIGENELIPRKVNERSEPADIIDFDEAGFTEADIAALRRVNNEPGQSEALTLDLLSAEVEAVPLTDLESAQAITRVPNGVAIAWADLDNQNWLSTSSDVRAWSTRPLSVGDGNVWLTESRMFAFSSVRRSIRRSGDLGRTWERTRRPFTSSLESLAIDDILIVNSEQPASFSDQTVSLNTGDYIVAITGAGRAFELTDPETGEVVLSGTLDDSATGVAFDPFGTGLAIADPASGEELLSVPQGALLQAYAEAANLEVAEIALTRWDPDADDPEWLIQPIDALFDDAVRVDFEVGEGQILAIVTTTTGYDLYVTGTE